MIAQTQPSDLLVQYDGSLTDFSGTPILLGPPAPAEQTPPTDTTPTLKYQQDMAMPSPAQFSSIPYTISSQVVDSATGNPIPSASIIFMQNGQQIDGMVTDANGFFAKTFYDNPPDSISISSVGYKPFSWPVYFPFQQTNFELEQDIQSLPPVTITAPPKTTAGKTNYAWLLLPVVLLVIAQKKKGVKTVGELKMSNVWPYILIAAALLGWNLINKFLQSLGIFTGPGNQQVHTQQTNPNSPWKPAFWQAAPAGALLLHDSDAVQMSNDIFNSFSVTQDDWERVFGVFSQLKTKSQVSYLADVFSKQSFSSWFGITHTSGLDLLTFITNGGGLFPWDGLSDAHLKIITDLVNNLPEYTA